MQYLICDRCAAQDGGVKLLPAHLESEYDRVCHLCRGEITERLRSELGLLESTGRRGFFIDAMRDDLNVLDGEA